MELRNAADLRNAAPPVRVPRPTAHRHGGSHAPDHEHPQPLPTDRPATLRVALGAVFITHGIDKFRAGLDVVEGAFAGWGVPAAGTAAAFAAGLEVIGGIALVIGLGTRLAAGLLGLVLIGALIFVKAELGIISTTPIPGAEIDIALLAGLVVLFIAGPGAAAVDSAIGVESRASLRPVTAD